MARALAWVQWLVVAAMLLTAAVLWQGAPDSMPVHWNLAGQPDRYGGKFEGLLLLPLVALVVQVLFEVLPRIDPHRARYGEFSFAYGVIRLGVLLVLAVTYAAILLWTAGVPVEIAPLIGGMTGALFIAIGLVIDQVRPNWFVGIRTPWTLSNERVWRETHRAGRWVFILMGVGLVLAGFTQALAAWALFIALSVLALMGLIAYSYVLWRREAAAQRPSSAG
jgi:uncharacterized membrane protein